MKTTKRFLGLLIIIASLAGQAGAQAFLTKGLVAYYPLNGTAADASGNGLDGTLSDGGSYTEDRFGQANQAVFFDNFRHNGANGRVDIPAAALDSGAGTISAWIKPSATSYGDITAKQVNGSNSIAIFSLGGTATGGYSQGCGMLIPGKAGKLYFHSQNSIPSAASSGTVTANVWQQVVVVYSSHSCCFYINGAPHGAAFGNYSVPRFSEPTTCSLGSWYAESPVPIAWLHLVGSLSDVRIYNRNLSSDEIAQLYQFEAGGMQSVAKLANQSLKPGTKSSQAGETEDEIISEEAAPDKTCAAVVFNRLGRVAAENTMLVSIRSQDETLDTRKNSMLFSARNAKKIRLRWDDSQHLVVSYSGGVVYDEVAIWHGISIIYENVKME